jgi:hypothetical protein
MKKQNRSPLAEARTSTGIRRWSFRWVHPGSTAGMGDHFIAGMSYT